MVALSVERVNPCHAELLTSIFHSFEAENADAISSFKWRKIFLCMKNWRLSKYIIRLAENLPQNVPVDIGGILFGLKSAI